MNVDVVWYSANPEAIARGYWDEAFLEEMFAGRLWKMPLTFTHHEVSDGVIPALDGAIMIIPARHHVDHVDLIRSEIAKLPWVVLFLVGDEEGEFPRDRLEHPAMLVYVQTPHHLGYRERAVGDFWPPDTPAMLADGPRDKLHNWGFLGQVNNQARRRCAAVLKERWRKRSDGKLLVTDGFTLGIERDRYLDNLATCRVAPCPPGNFTQDTFRLFEALEAGCIPVVESHDYWQMLFGDHPIPMLDTWGDFPEMLDSLVADWRPVANRISAWWQGHKREFVRRFVRDVTTLAGRPMGDGHFDAIDDEITVLIPTSPSYLHPSTEQIEQVVSSVRAQLPHSEIVVMLDGVSEVQAHRAADYEEYRRRVLWLCEHEWPNALPLYFEEHVHQAVMTKRALAHVHTPLLLFVEHDTDIFGEIPWSALCDGIATGQTHMVRLHHEALIQQEHRHLMLDDEPIDIAGAPLVRTAQWSQRPHLASTAFYRDITSTYFGDDSRTYLEDAMHGVVSTYYREMGEQGWYRFRLAIYAPDGDMKRSGHLDARGDDPKTDLIFAYDGRETPWGAPRATSERVD